MALNWSRMHRVCRGYSKALRSNEHRHIYTEWTKCIESGAKVAKAEIEPILDEMVKIVIGFDRIVQYIEDKKWHEK